MALTREQDRERQRRKRAARTPAQVEEDRRKARERMRRLARERGVPTMAERFPNAGKPKPLAMTLSERGRKGAATRWSGHVPNNQAARRAPAEVRSLYSRADRNSLIRRRYPTVADLDAAYARGELGKVA